MMILINKSKMENYVKDILFKQRVKRLDELNIETLVIFNEEILDKIVENPNINYKNKLLHLWTFKMPILVFIIFVFSYLIFPNIFGLSIICPI